MKEKYQINSGLSSKQYHCSKWPICTSRLIVTEWTFHLVLSGCSNQPHDLTILAFVTSFLLYHLFVGLDVKILVHLQCHVRQWVMRCNCLLLRW